MEVTIDKFGRILIPKKVDTVEFIKQTREEYLDRKMGL
jgi:bifunctional DNA-binding transcriptional regulator/antitoxin component of YhaV-PrlF toxin-antitoxin module